ncbi:hypothetical protein B0T10DRAFT_186949 [Thelonectria olida]|uniref:Uncharacterized protein n=1 Tax=Thelonectria olida TaxID=1576542 RepID=A0A9P8WEE3_9HYPO|nr:hypothetical protein B0T10DRAFT_186949 [Thelonectria olida]
MEAVSIGSHAGQESAAPSTAQMPSRYPARPARSGRLLPGQSVRNHDGPRSHRQNAITITVEIEPLGRLARPPTCCSLSRRNDPRAARCQDQEVSTPSSPQQALVVRAVSRQLRRFGLGAAPDRQTIGLTDYGSLLILLTHQSHLSHSLAHSQSVLGGPHYPELAALWVDLPLRGMDSRLISILGRGVASRVVVLRLDYSRFPMSLATDYQAPGKGPFSWSFTHLPSPHLTRISHHIIISLLPYTYTLLSAIPLLAL